MENMISYIRSNMLTFELMRPNELDALVFAWLSYLNLPECMGSARTDEGMALRDVFFAEHFEEMLKTTSDKDNTQTMLGAVAASPRFRNVKIIRYESETDREQNMQFAVMSFLVTDNIIFTAFRGTDSSVAGVIEDMNLSLTAEIPSQKRGREYLDELHAAYPDRDIITTGHSKGGNLSVYSAASCEQETRDSIALAFSFDGPGFLAEELERPGFKDLQPRIRKYLPHSSLVGLIFLQECEYTVIKSNAVGIGQHNPFTWEVEGGHFNEREQLSYQARAMYTSINNWIASLTQDDRERFIAVCYDMIEETGVSDFSEIANDWTRYIPVIGKKLIFMDKDSRSFMFHQLSTLASTSAKAVVDEAKK